MTYETPELRFVGGASTVVLGVSMPKLVNGIEYLWDEIPDHYDPPVEEAEW